MENGCDSTEISTHALTEGDAQGSWTVAKLRDFNSRPHGGRPCYIEAVRRYLDFNSRPHGGRRSDLGTSIFDRKFQLTPSRRATGKYLYACIKHRISTHALTEGDRVCCRRYRRPGHFNSRPHGGRLHASTFFLLSRNFNSRPHGGRRRGRQYLHGKLRISTHALTEGDGKFRQIFLLNRGYAYSISLYFLPHFISLLPQILSFQQKSFKFQVRIFLLFSVHLAFALQNQCVHHVKYRFCTNMFYFVFVLFTQIVKPQTIGLFIYDFF